MVIRTFLDKCTTIIKGKNENYGLNPIIMLNHGLITSRGLIHFSCDELVEKYNDGTLSFDSGVKHILKLTNCASLDDKTFHKLIPSDDVNGSKKRAVSFDVIAFEIPKEWDEGVGFDNGSDVWMTGVGAVSIEGSNWYQSQNGNDWEEEGIYSTDTLASEYIKYSNKEKSRIIGRMHFDHGNENFELDITNYVEKICKNKGNGNYGVGLCFTPLTEDSAITVTQYVGFFGNNTNTFFEPVVETRYDNVISDDRNNFYLGKTNRLYLYAYIGGELVNLDELPTCDIEGVKYAVKRQSKGVYYVEVKLTSKEHQKDEIISDIWGNLKYDGEDIDDVEQEFVTKASNMFFTMSGNIESQAKYNASVYGINDGEHIISNDVRIVNVLFKKAYSTEYVVKEKPMYRLYVKNGNKEVDVIDWDYINSTPESNFFYLDTNTLVPNEYYIDIKTKIGTEVKVFKNVVRFIIDSNSTNLKK